MARKVEPQSDYKLPNPLIYRLSNPNYTIYHRAALGGLAATIKAWAKEHPDGINGGVERDQVCLSWDEKISDRELLNSLIRASFRRDEENKIIELPGQQITAGLQDIRLAIH